MEAAPEVSVGIIGGGPGGYVAAIRAAQLGAAVTLIEKRHIGGTCLNVGCVPTKSLLHTAEVYEAAAGGASCGVVSEVRLDFAAAQNNKNDIVNKLVSGVEKLLKANRINLVKGEAAFTGPRSLSIHTEEGEKKLDFDKIIIASGSEPSRPPLPGLNSPQCVDSTGALAFTEVPESLIIIGGGVIGVEFANIYAALGTKVRIVEMQESILATLDGELARLAGRSLRKKGVEIQSGCKVLSIQDQGDTALVSVEDKKGPQDFSAQKILVAIGRRAATAPLDLEKAGIKQERGRIVVNERQETNIPGVYAVGDCASGIMLAHVASAQGEVAAENALGARAVFAPRAIPSCVYGEPEIAAVGLTEEQAKEQGLEYRVGKFPLVANAKALIADGGNGMVKTLVGKDGRILGVHIYGSRATELIAEAALALEKGLHLEDVATTIHAHPTVAEALRESALAADKRAIHILNR